MRNAARYLWCESARQVEPLRLAAAGNPAFEDRWIAVMPDAAWALRERGLPYVTLDGAYPEATIGRVAEDVLARLVRWAQATDDVLTGTVPEWRAAGFRPAHLTSYFLKICFDDVLLRTSIAAAFMRRAGPADYLAIAARPERIEFHLGFDESVYAAVLPAVAQSCGARLAQLPAIEGDRLSAFEGFWPPEPLGRRVARSIWRALPDAWRSGLRDRLRPDPPAPRSSEQRRPLLDRGYDVGLVRAELARRNVLFGDWQEFVAAVGMEAQSVAPSPGTLAAWELLKSQPFFWEPAQCDGIDVRGVIAPRLEAWWTLLVQPMWQAFDAGCRLALTRATAVLTAPAFSPAQLGAQGGARSAGVPVLTYQHGGFLGYCENVGLDVQDLALADGKLVYGDGVARTLAERAQHSGRALARPIAVGSARIDAMAGGITPERRAAIRGRLHATTGPLIVYVPTVFAGYTRQYCADSYPEVGYFELQLRIFELFARHPGVRLAYKAFVSNVPNPIPAALARLCPTALLITTPKLTELVWAADAIIVDFPSTALIEAVVTTAPVILYADKNSLALRPEARESLERRVKLTDSPDAFVATIAALLEGRAFEPLAAVDRSFELAYARHAGDGRSAVRAADALLERAGQRGQGTVA